MSYQESVGASVQHSADKPYPECVPHHVRCALAVEGLRDVVRQAEALLNRIREGDCTPENITVPHERGVAIPEPSLQQLLLELPMSVSENKGALVEIITAIEGALFGE